MSRSVRNGALFAHRVSRGRSTDAALMVRFCSHASIGGVTIAVSSNTATMIAQCRSALTETTVRYFSMIACRYLMLQKGSV
ncbi:hypothetical protein [Rhodanobacter koreensis]